MREIEELILTLKKQKEIYDKIISLSKSKEEAIVKKDVDTLNEIIKKEETYSISLVKLEEIRQKILKVIIRDYNIAKVDVLTDIYPYLKDVDAKKIDAVRVELKNSLNIVNHKNELNKALISRSMEQLEFDLNLLTAVSDNTNYRGDAEELDVERKSIFDKKV